MFSFNRFRRRLKKKTENNFIYFWICPATDRVCPPIQVKTEIKYENMKTKTSEVNNLQPSTCTLQRPPSTLQHEWSALRPNVNHLRTPGQPLRLLRWMFRHSWMLVVGFSMLVSGCQVLTYSSPTGERFTRSSLGANTSLQSLAFEATTNGLRRVDLRGYSTDNTQALGAVTDAAVKAAISAATK